MGAFNPFVTIASMLDARKLLLRGFYVGHRNDYARCQVLLWTQLLSRPTVFFDGSVMLHGDG